MSVRLLTNYHPFKLHTPGINLVLDYCDNCKLFSVVYCKQLRKLQSILNTGVLQRVSEKADNLETKIL